MEALIKVPSSEFNIELFEKIKSFLKNEYSLEVTISIREKGSDFFLNETQEEYWNRMDKSVEEVKEGKTIIFTMDELDKYLQKNFS
ncbi:MAG TPA: hypothetical protein VLS85_01020 [Hanamia sp.]|nr:hypothetical protein [Hanamia sp.]